MREHVLVPVLLPVALNQTYDYKVPPELDVDVGMFVKVPFGPQVRTGVVWHQSIGGSGKPVDAKKLKAIQDCLDVPPLPELSMQFAEWIARYCIGDLGMVLRMMMSASAVFETQKPKFGVKRVAGAPLPARMTDARQRVVDVSNDGEVRTKGRLAEDAACSTAVINGLVKSGVLVECALPAPVYRAPQHDHAKITFEDSDQQAAVHALTSAVDGQNFSTTLIDGVTGSGKTEVYFEAVARVLKHDHQALIMLPEIALTSQFIRRFEDRFGVKPVEWHSAISQRERGRIWRAVATGEARIVVGARSALFLPYHDLGLIVVDEEHDTSFKQDDRVHYQARDMAIVRASLGNFPVVLASATPSIESHVNARQGRYRHLILKSRYSGATMPDVSAIDLRQERPETGHWLSPTLVDEIDATLEQKQQTLLFLNRRGYAPLTLCRKCGHRVECPQCTAWLVEHRFRHRLHCHHCGFGLPIPNKCPKCASEESLVACGPGVERVAEEVAERFPNARTVLLSSDLVPGMKELRSLIAQIEEGAVDLIIGTQIVAKGHHFPNLALVGVVDGDLGLAMGADPRAGERTFQLLHQVTGRAGRAAAKGRGFVQTYMPEHPVMKAMVSGDREAFLEQEIAMRERGGLPPFGRLVALVVSARDKQIAEQYAREVARHAPPADRLTVLGPAEAPIAVVRGRHRWRLLVKAPKDLDVQTYCRQWLSQAPPAKGDLRLTIDVDPYSFL